MKAREGSPAHLARRDTRGGSGVIAEVSAAGRAQRGDFPAYFTDDVIASFEGTDQTAVGRDRAGRLIRFVHESAFDARAELKNLLVGEGKAAIEADFVGTHTGEFAGIQPTGRAVRVPYSVVYDLRADKISGLRIYFPMSLLVEQLTG